MGGRGRLATRTPAGLSCEHMKQVRDFIRTLKEERRTLGWKGLFRKRGWKLVALIVAFYLVRDTIIYIIIPLVIASRIAR